MIKEIKDESIEILLINKINLKIPLNHKTRNKRRFEKTRLRSKYKKRKKWDRIKNKKKIKRWKRRRKNKICPNDVNEESVILFSLCGLMCIFGAI